MKITLTKSEWDIVEHRLSCSDCLADCLEEVFEWCETDQRASDLWSQYSKQMRDLKRVEIDVETLSEMDKQILIDCLEGSTYFGSAEDAVESGELSKGKHLSNLKAAKSLEEKFEQAGLRTRGIPLA